MKKLIFSVLMLLPFAATTVWADLLPIREPKPEVQPQQDKASKDAKYLIGAVPEKDGIITFTKTLFVAGKTPAEVYPIVYEYIKGLVAAGRQDLRTRLVSEDPATGEVVAKVEEIMTFKKKFLNWDHTYFRYLISAKCDGEASGLKSTQVNLTITQISYYYGFDQDGNGGETYRAEEWISDKEAVNKAGTKLYPRSGKFRRKTVDRVEEIFQGAREALALDEDEYEEVIVRRKKKTQVTE